MTILSSVIESDIETVAKHSDEVDFFVIGSGTAGTTSAIELAAAGYNVVILEAGPLLSLQHIGTSPLRSQPEIVPKIHSLVKYDSSWLTEAEFDSTKSGALRTNNDCWSLVGGRTVFWGGCAPRFLAEDFQDWPFNYEEFAPFYERAENLMHVAGTAAQRPYFISSPVQDTLIEKFEKAGIHATNAPVGIDTTTVSAGHISRGFDSAVARLLRSRDLTKFGERRGLALVPNVIVSKLEERKDRIDKIHVVDRNTKKEYILSCKHAILAGGGIQSTRLVMDSGLDAGSDVLGRYISDHVFVQSLLKLRQPLNVPLYILLPATISQPFQVQLQGAFNETWYSPYHATVWLDSQPEGLYVLVYCFGVGTVEANNRLVLLDDTNSGGYRHHNYCVLYDRSAADRELIATMFDFVPKIADVFDAEVVRVQKNTTGSALHEHGGLRMGTDPDKSVTDQYGRFWRYKNLSCADAAVWPSQGAANPYLTITAFSLRHAQALIKGQQGRDKDEVYAQVDKNR